MLGETRHGGGTGFEQAGGGRFLRFHGIPMWLECELQAARLGSSPMTEPEQDQDQRLRLLEARLNRQQRQIRDQKVVMWVLVAMTFSYLLFKFVVWD